MEVIDDCFVAFFGAIFGAILPITSHVSVQSKKKNRWLEKTKKLKFYLSSMSTTLFVMSWVEYCGEKSTQLNSWQKNKVLNSTHSIHVRSWDWSDLSIHKKEVRSTCLWQIFPWTLRSFGVFLVCPDLVSPAWPWDLTWDQILDLLFFIPFPPSVYETFGSLRFRV